MRVAILFSVQTPGGCGTNNKRSGRLSPFEEEVNEELPAQEIPRRH
jgi:hypothetical protein